MLEMVPGRIGGDKAAREIESRVIIAGEQEGLLGGGGPPLVDGTVVLPEFANMRTPEAAIGTGFESRRRHKVPIVSLNVGLHRGAGANQATKALKFIGDQLVVGRVLERQKILQERFGFWWPLPAPITAAGGRLEVIAPLKEVSSKLVEPGTAHTEKGGGRGSVERTCVEVFENTADESGWLAVD